jgi:hypothetical protein
MKFTRSHYALLLLVFVPISNGLCQAFEKAGHKPFVGIVQVGYLSGTGSFNIDDDIIALNRGNAFRLRFVGAISFTEQLIVGIGAGLDGYHNPQFNTLPVVLDCRYFLTEQPRSLFISMNAGMAVKLSESFNSGFTGAINLGYRIPSGRRSRIFFEFGINAQQFSQANIVIVTSVGPEFRNDTFLLKSFALNAGFLF